MKSYLLLFLGIFAFSQTKAQTGQPVQAPIIVKRIGSTDTIATTFQAAYDIARNGDAIYLPGGIFTLSTVFNKRLFVYGTGFNADSSHAMSATRVQGRYVSGSQYVFALGNGSSGFYICGVDFTEIIEINQEVTANFQRCRVHTLSLSAGQFILNFNESIIGNTRVPIAPPYYSSWTLNITNSVIEGVLFTTNFGGVPNANLIIKNSIMLGMNNDNSLAASFRRVEIDKSIIFLRANVNTTLLSNVTTQTISNNLIISDLPSRVNLNSGTDSGNIIKNEAFRNSVLDSTSNYRVQPSCAECANKGVYSGTGNFRATAPVHITQREISIGSTNNRLRFKFTVKTSN